MLPQEQNGPLLPGADRPSETTQRLVDDEVRRIVEEAHADVTRLLTDRRDQLDSLTAALLREETLDEDAAYAAAQVSRESPDGEPSLPLSTATAEHDRNFRADARLKRPVYR